MSFLKINNISKSFNGHIALNDINLSINKGNIYALLGESGSGKSTLMRIVAGLLDADQGEIFLAEKEITGPKNHLVAGYEEIKLVSQDFDLFPHHSVVENILYPLRKYKDSYQEYRLNSMLKLCKLESYVSKIPSALSGGEQQRVALACALASEPALILLDEAFSHIDAIFRQVLKNVLVEISNNTSTTLCLVTHESIDALSIADEIAILKRGKILQKDSPKVIYQHPTKKYVAQLMGEINTIKKRTALQLTEINPELLTNKTIIIRPEHLKIVALEDTPFHGKIKNIRLMGPYFRLELTIPSEKEFIIVFSSQDIFTKNEVVGLKCNSDKLILIEKNLS